MDLYTNTNIIGVDEVGYGCWAGPLYICAAKFIKPLQFKVFDSKVLSELKREEIFEKLSGFAQYQMGIASVEEINTLGLSAAYKIALQRAIQNLSGEIYIDGRKPKYLECQAFEKGDSLIPQISAASIIAKVTRDNLMKNLSLEFPLYNFAKNKGYGTLEHRKALKLYGFCKLHRTCYNLDKYL